MPRLNAFFQLIEDEEIPQWKQKILDQKAAKKNSIKLVSNQKVIQNDKKLPILTKTEEIKEADKQITFDIQSIDSSFEIFQEEEEENVDDYNAYNIQDDNNSFFNYVGIEAIMRALSKRKKSSFELKLLTNALMHNPFFKKMRKQITETLYEDLFQEMYLESFRALDTIFQFGDQGDKFYIILKGDVYILSPSQLGLAMQQIEKKKQQHALQRLKTEVYQQTASNKIDNTDNIQQTPLNKSLFLNQQTLSKQCSIQTDLDQLPPLNLNNSMPSSLINEQEPSLKPSSVSVSHKKTDDVKVTNSQNTSTNQSIYQRKQTFDLRKLAINNHQNQQTMEESLANIVSSELQIQGDQMQANSSPSNFYFSDRIFERSQSINEVRSRVNSQNISSPTTVKNKRDRNCSGSDLSSSQILRKNIEQQIYREYPNFFIVKKLSVGDNFGEIALRSDKERSATVVCKTDCRFAVISKNAFQRILGDFFKSQLQEKEQFISRLDIFKGYSNAYLANILMNIKKKIYTFNDIIYEEGCTKQRFYFIKQGEVELSKKFIKKDQHEIKYEGSYDFNKCERVVMAQKQSNDWFGEVEIMQKVPRYTRARCVSAKLQVFYISATKFFASQDIEDMLTNLKKNSEMIDKWRQNHFDNQVNHIYNYKKDPLRKTFKNMSVAQKLINEKFKTEFLKSKPETIVVSNKAEENSIAAKIVYFNTVKNYVSKINDVIGTIQKSKQKKEVVKTEEKDQNIYDQYKMKQNEIRSQSLPRCVNSHLKNQTHNKSHNNSVQYKKDISLSRNDQQNTLKLTQQQLTNILDNSIKMIDKFSNQTTTNQSRSIPTVASSQSSFPSLYNPQQIQKYILQEQQAKMQKIPPQLHEQKQQQVEQNQLQEQIQQQEKTQQHDLKQYQLEQKQFPTQLQQKISLQQMQTDRERTLSTQHSTPQNQNIRVSNHKKAHSHYISQDELDDQTRNSSTQILTQANNSFIEAHLNKQSSSLDKIPRNHQTLESLYDSIISQKPIKSLCFSGSFNQKTIEEGLKNRMLNRHLPKQHKEDFSNLISISTKNSNQSQLNDNFIKEKLEKFKIFRKLKLDNILQYKYQNKKYNSKSPEQIKSHEMQKEEEKVEEEQSQKKISMNASNKSPILQNAFSNKIIQRKPIQQNILSLSQIQTPSQKTNLRYQIYQALTPYHFKHK